MSKGWSKTAGLRAPGEVLPATWPGGGGSVAAARGSPAPTQPAAARWAGPPDAPPAAALSLQTSLRRCWVPGIETIRPSLPIAPTRAADRLTITTLDSKRTLLTLDSLERGAARRRTALGFVMASGAHFPEPEAETVAATATAFLDARAAIKSTRDPKTAIQQVGLKGLYGDLSFEGKVASLLGACTMATAGSAKNEGRRLIYIKFIEKNFPFLPALPVRLEGALVYCAHYVLEQDNMAKYLGNVISQLRCGTKPLGEWGLSEDDEAQLLAIHKFLARSFPTESAPQPTLSLDQLSTLYDHLDSLDCVEARLCSALVKMMVAMQARASELLDGNLWAGDLVFHQYGVLISSVLNKCRKVSLDGTARVAPRLPQHLAQHDPLNSLHKHLMFDAGWNLAFPADNKIVFLTPIMGPGGKWKLSNTPLSADAGRGIILKHLKLAGVAHSTNLFSFSMHFGRGAGFNLLHNSLMIDRQLCAAAGGWRHGDVIDLHYHKRSPLELAVRIRLSLMQTGALMKWTLP